MSTTDTAKAAPAAGEIAARYTDEERAALVVHGIAADAKAQIAREGNAYVRPVYRPIKPEATKVYGAIREALDRGDVATGVLAATQFHLLCVAATAEVREYFKTAGIDYPGTDKLTRVAVARMLAALVYPAADDEDDEATSVRTARRERLVTNMQRAFSRAYIAPSKPASKTGEQGGDEGTDESESDDEGGENVPETIDVSGPIKVAEFVAERAERQGWEDEQWGEFVAALPVEAWNAFVDLVDNDENDEADEADEEAA